MSFVRSRRAGKIRVSGFQGRAAAWLLLLLLLPMSGAMAAASAAAEAARSYLERWQAESGAPGVSAAVSVAGELVFSGGVGVSDLESGMPQNGRSVHNIGSISKTQAVVAILQLVELGKVRLDAEVQEYVPWFPKKQRPVTVRQVLTHTSGIRHYRDDEFEPGELWMFRHYDRVEESARRWRDDPLVFDPGTRWMYSSFATNLLQAIVEAASEEPFEDYLSRHLWRPAGMADTRFDIPSRIVPRRGRGYERNRQTGLLENAVAEDVSYKFAGGGMLSTDEDLCRFGSALNSGRLLKPATLKEMYRLQLPPDIPYHDQEEREARRAAGGDTWIEPSMGTKQALIFMMERDAEGRGYAGHSGNVKGTDSRFANYYRDDVVVAIHFNSSSGDIDIRRAAEGLAQLYLPEAR